MSKKLKLGLLLFIIGFIGILSTLALRPMLIEESNNMFSDLSLLWDSKLKYIVFPTFTLIVTIIAGTLLYDKVKFKLPILEGIVDKNKRTNKSGILSYGIIGGIIAGVIITAMLLFSPQSSPDFLVLKANDKINALISLLHSGLTLEIFQRFGLMTFLVWVIYKITDKLTPSVYWVAMIVMIVISVLLKTFPLAEGTPDIALIAYNILFSAVGIIIYGWLYWKKGLESAMIAHLLAVLIITLASGLNV